MNTNEIKLRIATLEAQKRKADHKGRIRIESEVTGLKKRLNNAIEMQRRQRVYGTRNALIAEAATALQEKEAAEQEQKRLDFQVGQREQARAAYMAANNGSDSGFDTAWGEIQQQIAREAAAKAAAAYDPGGALKSAVVGAVLAKYRR